MAAQNKLNVLIIEDTVLVLERIKEMISDLPCISTITTATEFEGALHLIQAEVPDVILLDIHLHQKTSGIDILKFVNTQYPAVKVIIVSNKATDYYKQICREHGAHAFIDKSKEFEQIPTIIESLA
jgi:DNA-binding NarL/FixJ family response regulator